MDLTPKKIIEKANEYIINEQHLNLIKDAFEYAKKKHINQFRKSGEPYLIHPIAVAKILVEYQFGPDTIISGLLHDVLEDTDTEHEEISKKFGEDVANIVEGVTKITQLNFTSKAKAIAENHQKMILAMTEDLRVIIVKLADRLHNMRTIEFMPEEKRIMKCRETMEIFVPLAHRLGMYRMKAELEDIAYKHLDREGYVTISKNLANTKEQRNKDLIVVINDITKFLDQETIKHDIKGRIKNIYSIAKKMKQKNKNFEEIFDLLALRIIVDKIEDCYQVLGIIHHNFKPIPKRFKDYIAIPKINMYQSLHTTILTENGKIFEVQIRTLEMDRVAEIGIAAHWAYKEGKSKQIEQKEIAGVLKWYGDIIEQAKDRDSLANDDFLINIKEDLTANIFVFTPNGDVIMLPKGATPIDFAYRIHSQVGERCVGAIVNNKMVPLDFPLDTGDICNIRTSKTSSGPSDSWLKIAKTAQARSKIRTFINKRDRDLLIEEGRKKIEEVLPEYELGKKLEDSDVKKYYNTNEIYDLESLLYNIGKNNISARSALNKLSGKAEIKQDEATLIEQLNKSAKAKQINIHGILVDGLNNSKIKLSNCCNPIPGDPITGFVTKGMGIAVHRETCSNILKSDSNRLIPVYWSSSNTNQKYRVHLKILTFKRNNMVVDIINTISAQGANISNINTSSKNSENIIKVGLDVLNLNQLDKLMTKIRNIEDVYQIVRVNK
ncbi:bifunctional (p)ppGpp synthetase/guanosine-3',5'-bis(diphosphate) 3'-pyrophosphohydrolase [Mycoplasmatota bacterium]|nr:bifunctional (p)ppGpp synthetase/guanosine-3',5'-bis(diphosphate) 3'-pyrophosphohydrolase [Mycoplasmatota bacterium]